jgi:hypothetical protein
LGWQQCQWHGGTQRLVDDRNVIILDEFFELARSIFAASGGLGASNAE